MRFLYGLVYKIAAVFFNILNLLLFGNLPPFGCACTIVEEQGRFLVVKRGNNYTFPGGYMRWREHPTQTARREGFEETGLCLKIGELIGYHSADSSSPLHMSTLILAFNGSVIGGELRDSIEGRAIWVDEAELQSKLTIHYRHLFERYRTMRAQTQDAPVASEQSSKSR